MEEVQEYQGCQTHEFTQIRKWSVDLTLKLKS